MKITAANRVSRQSFPVTTEPTPKPAVARGWTPASTTRSSADQLRMLGRTLDDAVTLPPGASFKARLGHVRAALASAGKDGVRATAERLTARLPARDEAERERILRLATALGARTPALAQRLLKDAISAGDARLALELVDDGATLTKTDRAKLAPHVRGDEVLLSADATRNLSRAAVSVLADQPAALERFARSLSAPSILFTEVLANKDRALAVALKPLVSLLTPKEADALARRHSNLAELLGDLRTRASQR
jgi:hypothetical protein